MSSRPPRRDDVLRDRAKARPSNPFLVRAEQTNEGQFDPHRPRRHLLPRVGFDLDSFLASCVIRRALLLHLPLPLLLGPLLVTIGPALVHRSLHVGITRPGGSVILGGDRLLAPGGRSLLTRNGLRRWHHGLSPCRRVLRNRSGRLRRGSLCSGRL